MSSHPLFDITGRIALITGSSRGIGKALAKGLAEAGARVVLNGRDAEALDRTRSELTRRPGPRSWHRASTSPIPPPWWLESPRSRTAWDRSTY